MFRGFSKLSGKCEEILVQNYNMIISFCTISTSGFYCGEAELQVDKLIGHPLQAPLLW